MEPLACKVETRCISIICIGEIDRIDRGVMESHRS